MLTSDHEPHSMQTIRSYASRGRTVLACRDLRLHRAGHEPPEPTERCRRIPEQGGGARRAGQVAMALDEGEEPLRVDAVEPVKDAIDRDSVDAERLLALVERHRDLTGSARATALLRDPSAALGRFGRLVPRLGGGRRSRPGEDRATA